MVSNPPSALNEAAATGALAGFRPMVGDIEEGPGVWRLLLVIMVLASAPALIAQTETPSEKPPIQPPEALSVTDIVSVNPCAPNGTVVLDVLISDTGEVQKVEVRRDIACLTQLAVQAVKDWKFSPATFAGKAIAARMPVAVTFSPPLSQAEPFPLPALVPQTEAAIQAEFQPAEVTRVLFPPYPSTTIVSATVALEVTLSAKGEAGEVKVLRDLTPLADNAKAVLDDWRFIPATFNGNPVPSKIVLAFVSQPLIAIAP